MGLKLVLVIALLGAAALDWLASAEQVWKYPNLKLRAATEKLRNSSLTPEEVTQILLPLGRYEYIDGVLNELLLSVRTTSSCEIWHQQKREENSKRVTLPSLKNYCNHWVRHFRDYCKENPVLVVEENFGYLKDNMEILTPVLDEAEMRGEDLDTFVQNWVTKLDEGAQAGFSAMCKRFLEEKEQMMKHFGIDAGQIARELPELKYFNHANLHCATIRRAYWQITRELTAPEAKEKLSNLSLVPGEVAKILNRLDEKVELDGVRVDELLWPDGEWVFSMHGQERRKNTCKRISTYSLRRYCDDLVERVQQYCQKHPIETLKYCYDPGLASRVISILQPVVEEEQTLSSREKTISQWVTRQTSSRLYSLEVHCRQFSGCEQQMMATFGIDLKEVVAGLEQHHQSKYLHQEHLFCGTFLKVVEKNREHKSRSGLRCLIGCS
jgi:hypothetical protein